MKLKKKKGLHIVSGRWNDQSGSRYGWQPFIIESTRRAKEFFEKHPLTPEVLKKLREEGKAEV